MKLTEHERSLLYATCNDCGKTLYDSRTKFVEIQESELNNLSKDERKLIYYACTKSGDDLLEENKNDEAIEFYMLALRVLLEDTE